MPLLIQEPPLDLRTAALWAQIVSAGLLIAVLVGQIVATWSMKRAADAAKVQADTFHPIIMTDNVSPLMVGGNPERGSWSVKFRNAGKTIAYDLRVYVRIWTEPDGTLFETAKEEGDLPAGEEGSVGWIKTFSPEYSAVVDRLGSGDMSIKWSYSVTYRESPESERYYHSTSEGGMVKFADPEPGNPPQWVWQMADRTVHRNTPPPTESSEVSRS